MDSHGTRNHFALGLAAALATTVIVVIGSLAQAVAQAQYYF